MLNIFSPSVRRIRPWQRGADNRESEGQGEQSPALLTREKFALRHCGIYVICYKYTVHACRGHVQDFFFLCLRKQNQRCRVTPSTQVSCHPDLSTKFPLQTSVQQVRYIITRGTKLVINPTQLRNYFLFYCCSTQIQSLAWKQEETRR